MNFNLIQSNEKTYKKKTFMSNRNLSILEFNVRVLNMAKDLSIPIMERLNYISIVSSNLKEFIQTRLFEASLNEISNLSRYIQSIYQEMDKCLGLVTIDLPKQVVLDLPEQKNSKLQEDTIYCVYYEKNRKDFTLTPIVKSLETTKEIIKAQHMMGRGSIFFVKFIRDKTVAYQYSDVDLYENVARISTLVNIKESAPFRCMITTTDDVDIIEAFLKFMRFYNVQTFHVSEKLIAIAEYNDAYRSIVTEPSSYYPVTPIHYIKHDYYEYLRHQNLLIRTPYDSYQHVVDFIEQMCHHPNCSSIMISLYRVARDSKIVKALCDAGDLGKRVYVYTELCARGDEERNLSVIKTLSMHNVNVSCNYFCYKVHAKLFCAICDNDIYTHIGTGNYNEKTSSMYTDFHLLTSNQGIGLDVIRLFMKIFKKEIYVSSASKNITFSPFDFRPTLTKLIRNEMKKGDKGKILIKCNSLCDAHIINQLISASEKGVKIRIICRTGCSIIPSENIELISKVGKYLEHERIYCFGDRVFISSADLLMRNLSKRIETLCEIKEPRLKKKVYDTFEEVWNSDNVYELSSNGIWRPR